MSNRQIVTQLKKIKSLELIGKPKADWVKSNREILMHQINPQGKITKIELSNYYWEFFYSNLQQKFLRPALMAILVFGAYFGYSATIMAAKASLPGEPLYPIKVLGENLVLATAISDEAKVKLKMDFVSRRGDELRQLARQPENTQKVENISQTVKKITQDVGEIKNKLEKISSQTSDTNSIINTAKTIDEKTLKVEKDIVDAHAVLTNEVKKEVAKEVKEAIVKTEEVGAKALTVIVDKADNPEAKNSVTDKEITDRVGERIKNAEASVQVIAEEVKKISSSTSDIVLNNNKVITSSTTGSTTSTTINKEVVKEVTEIKPSLAQETIEQAKSLLESKDFSGALQKIQETKAIVAEVIEKTPIIDQQIKTQTVNISSSSSTINDTSTSSDVMTTQAK